MAFAVALCTLLVSNTWLSSRSQRPVPEIVIKTCYKRLQYNYDNTEHRFIPEDSPAGSGGAGTGVLSLRRDARFPVKHCTALVELVGLQKHMVLNLGSSNVAIECWLAVSCLSAFPP